MIIQAMPGDFDRVRDITIKTIRNIYPKYYPKGAVDYFCFYHSDDNIIKDIKNGYVYLSKIGNDYVGTITVKNNHVYRLFILPAFQHMGHGRALMDFAEDKIFQTFNTVKLDASFPAKHIYLKRGYKETGYYVVDTPNGDKLCYDTMEKESK